MAQPYMFAFTRAFPVIPVAVIIATFRRLNQLDRVSIELQAAPSTRKRPKSQAIAATFDRDGRVRAREKKEYGR